MSADASRKGLPRVFEAAAALLALGAAAPLLLACALLVKLTSRGPVLFRQERLGRGGVPFSMVKFRTMRLENAGPQVTARGDPRITAVGRVLRTTKLDELPELWNVVRGDMALVGPRPEVPRYVDAGDALWREVLSVRPGVTDPVTLRLRGEEELLAAAEDAERFYVETLLPYKLILARRYLRARTWRSDIGVLVGTMAAIVRGRLATPPTRAEIEAFVRAERGEATSP